MKDVSMADVSSVVIRERKPVTLADESNFPIRSLRVDNGLCINVLPNGCVYSIARGEILINQVLASPVEGGINRLFLRISGSDRIQYCEIIGPASASIFSTAADRFEWSGEWDALSYTCTCWLHPSGDTWFFHVEVVNKSSLPICWDAVLLQDLGLATRGQVRNNELFTAQYMDHQLMNDPGIGQILMSRQNLPQTNGTFPWLMQGCLPGAAGALTDGIEFFGTQYKYDSIPIAMSRVVIGDRVRQYEQAFTALQSVPTHANPRETGECSFFAHFVADHPLPSSSSDLTSMSTVRQMHEDFKSAIASPIPMLQSKPDRSIFNRSPLFESGDLTASDLSRLFAGTHRHLEKKGEEILSLFYGQDARHVVLRAKEICSVRPHGHIMRAGEGLMPDDEVMSCAFYAAGVFASQLTLGNTSLIKLLSPVRDTLNIVRSKGLRVFVRHSSAQAWQLLGVPSAFEMARDRCKWHYKSVKSEIVVTCKAAQADPAMSYEINVIGKSVELLISGEIACGPTEYDQPSRMTIDPSRARISIGPDSDSLIGKKYPELAFHWVTPNAEVVEEMGGDELLGDGRVNRGLPFFVVRTRATESFKFTILGSLDDTARGESLCEKYESENDSTLSLSSPTPFWSTISANIRLTSPTLPVETSEIQDALSWFARDAIIHLGTPRGLEQANGGAWGVRDVCQGPVEFLLSYDHVEVVANILTRLFAQQYEQRCDWPQWFMFPAFEEIQSTHCHGDVLIWPLKALCDYLEHTNDGSFLQKIVSYTDDKTFQPTARRESILQHVDRLLLKMRSEFVQGLALPKYGDGDWDDSLQPADPSFRERMVSSWTTELMYQTIRRYAAALSHFCEAERAATTQNLADSILADFQRHLIPDGVVAGFALFDGFRPNEFLLHPRDQRTGLRYRLIPMTRGIISHAFTPEQAKNHLDLIEHHLLFPDGARLMDRPTTYDGGRERIFRRSESAAFFGREIGLQYVHAHLRYAEALAVMGRGAALFKALQQVNPISVTRVVPNALARQRNCYFSSSDAAFVDRHDATRNYGKLRSGEVPVDGGWRIYSSGPGIYTNMVIRQMLGLRKRFDCIEFDPVLPAELSGLTCHLSLAGRQFQYKFLNAQHGARQVHVNGKTVQARAQKDNPYRPGAIGIDRREFESLLTHGENLIVIET